MAYTHTQASTAANSSGYRIAAWAGVALQALALVAVVWLQRWGGALSLSVFLVLSAGFLLMKERLPSLFSFLIVLAALVNAFGWAWNWFNQFVWYDEVVHLFSSFAVLAAIAWLAWAEEWIHSDPAGGKFILQLAAMGLALGIAWEVLEAVFVNLARFDTVTDLVLDVIGAALGGWFAGAVINRERARGTVR